MLRRVPLQGRAPLLLLCISYHAIIQEPAAGCGASQAPLPIGICIIVINIKSNEYFNEYRKIMNIAMNIGKYNEYLNKKYNLYFCVTIKNVYLKCWKKVIDTLSVRRPKTHQTNR